MTPWRYVGRWPATSGDGQSVEVWEVQLPARAWRLEVRPGANSVGEPRPGYTIETGAGGADMASLIARLVSAIQGGMVSVEPARK